MAVVTPIERIALNLVSLHELFALLIDLLVSLLALFILLNDALVQDLGLRLILLTRL